MLKHLLTVFFLCILYQTGSSQTIVVNDSFSDGNLSGDPVWSGNLEDFIITNENGNNRLQLNAEASPNRSQLRVASNTAYGSWEFFYRPMASASNTNRAFFFVTSDSEDLNYLDGSTLNGYAVRAGDNTSPRVFRLVRFTNGVSTNLLESTLEITPSTDYQIKVTRNSNNEWTMSINTGYESNPDQGDVVGPIIDDTHQASQWAGILVTYSSLNTQNFFFDDIRITNSAPFIISSVTETAPNAIDVLFNYPLKEVGITATDFEISEFGTAESASLQGSNTVRLTFAQEFENQEYVLQVSNVENIGSVVIAENSQFPFSFSNPFFITASESISSSEFRISFSRNVDPKTIITSNFSLDSGTGPLESVRLLSENSVALDFSSPLSSGEYIVRISGVTSEAGFPIRFNSEVRFFLFDEYSAGDLVLNEFWYRGTGMPRYVEIFNTSEKVLNLKNFELRRREGASSNGGIISANDIPIRPKGYVVVSADSAQMRTTFGAGDYFQMNGYPGFTQTTPDTVRFFAPSEILIETIPYNPSVWPGNGLAIERRSPLVASEFLANWAASVAENGGTPGQTNTAQAPNEPPQILSVQSTESGKITVIIERDMNSNTIEDVANYSLSDGLSISSVRYVAPDSVFLFSDEPFPVNRPLSLSINGISDIFGNTISNYITEFTLFGFEDAEEGDIVINEFWYDGRGENIRYVELLNTSEKFITLKDWEIRRRSEATSNGGKISEIDLAFAPNSFLVLTGDTTGIKNRFGDGPYVEMSFPGFPSTSEDSVRLIKPDGNLYEFIAYVPNTWGGDGVALERRSPLVSANLIINWGESIETLGGTPGKPNTVPLDVNPPVLVSVFAENSHRILFNFNEPLDKSLLELSDFTVSDRSLKELVSVSASQLAIDVEPALENGDSYALSVRNVRDVFGNVANEITSSIEFFVISNVEMGDVVINEFIHNPPDGLTDAVEIWNRSEKSFDINGWKFSDNRSTVSITEIPRVLPPNRYLVIAPDSLVFPLLPEGTLFYALPSFPSLNNSSDDAVVVRNALGTALDSVVYSTSWGGSEFALERRSTEISGLFRENWGRSPAEQRHTLGLPNLIEPDTIPPRLQFVTFSSDSSIDMVFSERLVNFSLDFVESSSPSFTDFQQIADTLRFIANVQFTDAQTVAIRISPVFDLFGNQSPASAISRVYYDVQEPVAGSVFINEFMYDPAPGYPEYVEIFNDANFAVDLSQLTMGNLGGTQRAVSSVRTALPPKSYAVLSPDTTLRTFFSGIPIIEMGSQFSSLRNTNDGIILKNRNGELVDSLSYSNAWGGRDVALERRSLDIPASVVSNWGDSPSPKFGTPGSENLVEPDESPPFLVAIDVLDSQSLRLNFNEPINSQSVQNSDFVISPALTISAIIVTEDIVRIEFAEEILLGDSYEISISTVSDLFLNQIADTSAFFVWYSFEHASVGDIVINEILYQNGTSIPEFVEIFNRSNRTIDLNGWQFSDEAATVTLRAPLTKRAKAGLSIPIAPDSFVVITGDIEFAKAVSGGFYLPNLPSLSNVGDAVVIRTPNGEVVDSVFYFSSWGGGSQVSIERKDPFNLSNDPANWATNPQGISAGKPNFAFELDETAPSLIFASTLGNEMLRLRFSEFVQLPSSLGIFVDGVKKTFSSPNSQVSNETRIFYGSDLGEARPMKLVVDSLRDVRGNISLNQEIQVAWPLQAGDVVLNEIMFQPIASSTDNLPDQSQYVEVKNARGWTISMEGFFLHDAPNENGVFTSLDVLETNFSALGAGEYAVVYADTAPNFEASRLNIYFEPEENFHSYRVNRTTLSLNSTGDALFLSDSAGTTIDSVFYSNEWHNPNIADVRGIALERINPQRNSNESFNWGSSTEPRGGTPGRGNTLFIESDSELSETDIIIEPNPFSPDGDGFEDVVSFSYKLDEPDYLLRVRIFDRYGRMVRELVNNYPAGFSGEVIWDGFDVTGKAVRIGIYVVIFEAYNSMAGSNRNFKRTVVSARRM